LEENKQLKSQLEYFRGVLDDNIREILSRLHNHGTEFSKLNRKAILNGHDIQTLSDSFEESDNLRFHVETRISTVYWPLETDVTYEREVVDTHDAMDIGLGIFTAPMTGVYGFFLYSEFYCDYNVRILYLYHNEEKVSIQLCHKDLPEGSGYSSNSVYFAREMNVGDTLKIFSGSAQLHLNFPAKFMGFLLERKLILK
jgi:hypothetical protein